jgi:hypothetical protein
VGKRKARQGYKGRLITRVHALVRRRWPEAANEPYGNCLYTAGAFIHLAAKDPHFKDRRFVLQAGSGYWPRLTPEQDDGDPSTHTHFGYEWEGRTPSNMMRVQAGLLPEMHVWVGDPKRQELIDLTTGRWVEHCQVIQGLAWPGVQPPEFFWGGPDDLPDSVVYKPDGEATFLALDLLKRALAQPG